jgi:hypothetical protein
MRRITPAIYLTKGFITDIKNEKSRRENKEETISYSKIYNSIICHESIVPKFISNCVRDNVEAEHDVIQQRLFRVSATQHSNTTVLHRHHGPQLTS